MPLIQANLIKEAFRPAQKEDIITKFTGTMVAIVGRSVRPVNWIVINEIRSDEQGIAGQALPPREVPALAAGQNERGPS